MAENPPINNADVAVNLGRKEFKVPSIPFHELAGQLANRYPRYFREEEKGRVEVTNLCFFGVKPRREGTFIGVVYDPPLSYMRNRLLAARLYDVSDSEVKTFHAGKLGQRQELPVHKLTVAQILNPHYIVDIDENDELSARDVLVPINQKSADKIGGWVVDSDLRKHIEDHGAYRDKVHKNFRLREAINNPRRVLKPNFEDFSGPLLEIKYDYSTIKEIAEKEKDLKNPEYTLEDIAWLEEHMRAKGIPIPGTL